MAQRRKSSGNSDSHTTRGTAPSAANIEELEKFEASDEAKRTEPSDVDAMGQDKRRQVIGHSYGPSRRSQIMFFVAVAAVLIIVVGGWFALVAAFDNPPSDSNGGAPWSQTVTNENLAAQQNTPPRSPDTPCGEPGNAFPVPQGSPCNQTASTEQKPSQSSAGK
jgi:hypothetical protein